MAYDLLNRIDVANILGDRTYSFNYRDGVIALLIDDKFVFHTKDKFEAIDFIQEIIDGYMTYGRMWLKETEEDILASA